MVQDEIDGIIQSGDELVRSSDLGTPEFKDFKESDPIAILIHGFTSHGKYMRKLGAELEKWEIRAFLFNYNSYRGIPLAADNLKSMVQMYNTLTGGEIKKKKLFLIAHSMGGLVARSFAIDPEAREFVRGIIMLGTPNKGTLADSRILKYFVQYGEHISRRAMPEARMPTCISGKQLIKSDGGGTSFIDQLNEAWKKLPDNIPTLTIAGGKRRLSFCRNWLLNQALNYRVQRLIGNQANDGLVAEDSVDLTSFVPTIHEKYSHFNSYPDYPDLNHTNLTRNHRLALEAIKWIKERQRTASATKP
jgi:pimeloyl-ACP methyl ester carboxylesterase